VAEYRALRATVLRLCGDAAASGPDAMEDAGRFNEAIDQAIAESVDYFTDEVDRWRAVFVGVLGHDLRGPLNAVLLTSQVISTLSAGTPVSQRKADEATAERPAASTIELATEGVTQGCWDASRIKQVVSNLVINAALYGNPNGTVHVSLRGEQSQVQLSVENRGPSIPKGLMNCMFEPLRRRAGADSQGERESLGLGLSIVHAWLNTEQPKPEGLASSGSSVAECQPPLRDEPLAWGVRGL
jgi:signal transduction histidine kinase